MGGQEMQVALIVWRESVEALLVIGILDAWLRNAGSDARQRGRRILWLGATIGILLAVALAGVFVAIANSLEGDEEAWFRTVMVLVAAILIMQVVLWMRAHGAALRDTLGMKMRDSAARASWLGVFLLAAIAVAREGSETVIFVYGILAAGGASANTATLAMALGAGFIAAGATFALIALGSRIVTWRTFFRVTEILLLLLACSLVLSAASDLIGLGVLPPLSGPLWDSSPILDDFGPIGGLVAGLTGYRAKPEAILLIVFGAYWVFVVWRVLRPTQRRSGNGPSPAQG